MHEISPVLAGTFDSPDHALAKANFNLPVRLLPARHGSNTPMTTVASADPRRYTKFDRTASNAGSTTTFSFGDFLDAINPLQHIPVISSIYREATGETINPVARVAGDVMYGGVFGLASAVMAGLGAVGNSAMEETTGKDATGTVVAALFGDDKKAQRSQETKLALASGISQQPAMQGLAIQPQVGATPQAPWHR